VVAEANAGVSAPALSASADSAAFVEAKREAVITYSRTLLLAGAATTVEPEGRPERANVTVTVITFSPSTRSQTFAAHGPAAVATMAHELGLEYDDFHVVDWRDVL
jgi:hypothetical protein